MGRLRRFEASARLEQLQPTGDCPWQHQIWQQLADATHSFAQGASLKGTFCQHVQSLRCQLARTVTSLINVAKKERAKQRQSNHSIRRQLNLRISAQPDRWFKLHRSSYHSEPSPQRRPWSRGARHHQLIKLKRRYQLAPVQYSSQQHGGLARAYWLPATAQNPN